MQSKQLLLLSQGVGKMLINELANIEKTELENTLWKIGMNLHNETDAMHHEYLLFLMTNRQQIGDRMYFRSLTNILHVFYANMSDSNKNLYVNMLLAAYTQGIGNVGLGDLMELLGITVKGCNAEQKEWLFHFVQDHFELCLDDAGALVSICNCYRYMYPEQSAEHRAEIIDMLSTLIAKNPYPELDATLNFTAHSLRETLI